MKDFSVTVNSATGLHARPASQLVSEASKFQSEIKLIKGETSVSAKSIMGVLGLGVLTGDKVRITADGADEHDAIKALEALFESGL
ncbi:HPr family phosphocarrier protein [Fusibacter ferrireducens]|uniref:Phosphocarrier protein HPr n=1 Tax=Fusibacter ferrireducens TaxID=2785058 RepID=A0ABR9ZRS9_9FIRM|nr:HPr family phosphocarrier protein [Fusibacter ferrireducens]MBF4693161.1 HPr family phosphocarrier protein [Fusibacter ferrireducens]